MRPVDQGHCSKCPWISSAQSVVATPVRTQCPVGGARSQGSFKQWVPPHHDPAIPLPDLLRALAKALPTILLTACPLLPWCTRQPERYAALTAGVEYLGFL